MERRVFKETLMTYYKLIYVIVAVCCIFCMWNKHVVIAVPLVVILLLITDRLVKGEYIMESEVLVLKRGRFVKDRTILIGSVRSVNVYRGFKAIRGSVRLVMDGDVVFLNPENADGFVDALCKRNMNISVNG